MLQWKHIIMLFCWIFLSYPWECLLSLERNAELCCVWMFPSFSATSISEMLPSQLHTGHRKVTFQCVCVCMCSYTCNQLMHTGVEKRSCNKEHQRPLWRVIRLVICQKKLPKVVWTECVCDVSEMFGFWHHSAYGATWASPHCICCAT